MKSFRVLMELKTFMKLRTESERRMMMAELVRKPAGSEQKTSAFVRKYPDLVDVRRLYDLPFFEVMNPTGKRDPGKAKRHRIASYVTYAGRDLYIGLPDKHVVGLYGWPREMETCRVSMAQVASKYGLSESMYFGQPYMYFVQMNEGAKFAYLRENQSEAVLSMSKPATHVMLTLNYRARELKSGGSAKDWAERRGATGFYKMDTGTRDKDGRKIFADILIFKLGGECENWYGLRKKMTEILEQKAVDDREKIDTFYQYREENKKTFQSLRHRIEERGLTPRYYENSMDVVVQRPYHGCAEGMMTEVCYNFRYTRVDVGALSMIINNSRICGWLGTDKKVWHGASASGMINFDGKLSIGVPWWKEILEA